MSSNVKLAYGGATSFTITGIGTLGNNTSAVGPVIDNSSNLYLDYLVEVLVTVGTVVAPAYVSIYVIASLDNTNYEDQTLANMRLIGTISTPTNTTTYRGPAMSVAAAYGGAVPPQFKVVVNNQSGAALTAGSSQYNAVYSTVG